MIRIRTTTSSRTSPGWGVFALELVLACTAGVLVGVFAVAVDQVAVVVVVGLVVATAVAEGLWRLEHAAGRGRAPGRGRDSSDCT